MFLGEPPILAMIKIHREYYMTCRQQLSIDDHENFLKLHGWDLESYGKERRKIMDDL